MKTSDLPSQTALMAAAARAAHLIVDHEPVIFADDLAATLLGDRADEFISCHAADPMITRPGAFPCVVCPAGRFARFCVPCAADAG